jgi:Xylose isomerase-like TIM barrel
MKLGIKVGPQKESYERIARSDAEFVEIWYNANTPEAYTELFDELKRRNTPAGLHFWAALPDKTLTNLAYPDKHLINETIRLIQATIDTAAHINAPYVNIHPGGQCKTVVDFATNSYISISDPAPFEASKQLFLEHVHALHDYANQRGVILTVETVPLHEMNDWYNPASRNHPIETGLLPASVLLEAAANGTWIANDFCHTAAHVISDTPEPVWSYLKDVSTKLAPYTRLIHVGFVVPPYTGTDFHDAFNNLLFETNLAIPNKSQTIELLKLFNHRDDVYVLAEPIHNHVENYLFLKKLLQEASKYEANSKPL